MSNKKLLILSVICGIFAVFAIAEMTLYIEKKYQEHERQKGLRVMFIDM